jgi:predicted O-methyltransferase YrrM
MQKLINKLVSEINSESWLKLQNKISNFPNVECSTSNADCFFLALLVKKYKPINILEIGTYVGKSTYSLACAAKSNGGKFNIDTIDIQKKSIKRKFAKFKEVKFHNGHSSKLLPNFKKRYDFIFIDGNLDDETVITLKKLVKRKTLIVLHDFCPPIDKGIYDLFYLSKFFNFNYYHPQFSKNFIKKVNEFTTEVNFFKNYKIDKTKINLCCCLITFKSINNNEHMHINSSKKIIGNNVIFATLLTIAVFIDQLLHLRKRILIYKFFNKIFVIDLHEKKIIKSIIDKKHIYFQKVYFLSDFYLKFLFGLKNFIFRFKI